MLARKIYGRENKTHVDVINLRSESTLPRQFISSIYLTRSSNKETSTNNMTLWWV